MIKTPKQHSSAFRTLIHRSNSKPLPIGLTNLRLFVRHWLRVFLINPRNKATRTLCIVLIGRVSISQPKLLSRCLAVKEQRSQDNDEKLQHGWHEHAVSQDNEEDSQVDWMPDKPKDSACTKLGTAGGLWQRSEAPSK